MNEIKIKDNFIKLEQAMKLSGACSSGSEAKYAIQGGQVRLNGEIELRRGKKLRDGDVFNFEGYDYKIIGA
jgi:hypothetical protein